MRRPLPLRILSALLDAANEVEIVGDLEENYGSRLEREGPLRAGLWLWRQTLALPLWLFLSHLDLRGTPAEDRTPLHGDSFMRSRSEDIRFAIRNFFRSPGFSAVTVLTLSLAIGANAAIFSVVDGVLLEALPYEHADELVYISHAAPGVGLEEIGTANGIQIVYEEAASRMRDITTFTYRTANLTGEGEPVRVQSVAATASLFETLGSSPALGRVFTAAEDVVGGPLVAVISHGLWSSRYGSDPSVLGRTLILNARSYEVIGVMPEGFAFPEPDVQIWQPIRLDREATGFGGFNVQGIARLSAGSSIESAEAEMNQLLPRIVDRYEDITPEIFASADMSARARPFKEMVVGPVESALWILMGTVGLVLLIACANIGNLFLARAEGRQKEVAIRTAMGAGRRDLFWQYATESGILAVASGLLGVALAFVGLRVLVAYAPGDVPRIDEVGLDGSVLAFTALISLGAAFFFGAIPMLRHAMGSAGTVLRDGSRGSTAGKRSGRGRQLLVASQVAFAMVLLVGSALMLQSFRQLLDVELGFNPEDVVTFRMTLSGEYPDTESVARFHGQAIDRIEQIPGVIRAGAVSALPISTDWSGDPLNREEVPLDPGELPPVISLKAASPGYFEAMEIPVLAGRVFERADVSDRAPVAVINATLAERFWPGEDPVGRRIMHGLPGQGEWSTIVGIVGDTPRSGLTDPMEGLVYYSTSPAPESNVTWLSRSITYAVRYDGAPEAVVSAIRAAVRELDPDLPLASVRMLDEHVAGARVQMAFTMLLLSIAAVMGLVLGAVGIYGVISYLTAMRTREIGVRMALGAEAGSVRSMVLRQGAGVALLGVVIGLIGAVGLTRFMDALLYEVSATDPTTFGGVAVLLFGVSLFATWVPARRAARTAPSEALRQD